MMLGAVIIAGFTLGAVGSLHCVGMCGPLSLALPTYHLSSGIRFFSLLFYQFGRITTYAFIGLLFGLAGRRIYINGYQQWFTIGLGLFILSLALLYFLHKYSLHFSFLNVFYNNVQLLIARLLQKAKHPFGFFVMGMANGLLPCGMVYVAVAATLSFTEVWKSIIFMAMFGAGTLPAMMLIGYAGRAMKPGIRRMLRRAVPYFLIFVGVVLILRGLNLGIPFISPQLPAIPGDSVVCHP